MRHFDAGVNALLYGPDGVLGEERAAHGDRRLGRHQVQYCVMAQKELAQPPAYKEEIEIALLLAPTSSSAAPCSTATDAPRTSSRPGQGDDGRMTGR